MDIRNGKSDRRSHLSRLPNPGPVSAANFGCFFRNDDRVSRAKRSIQGVAREPTAATALGGEYRPVRADDEHALLVSNRRGSTGLTQVPFRGAPGLGADSRGIEHLS